MKIDNITDASWLKKNNSFIYNLSLLNFYFEHGQSWKLKNNSYYLNLTALNNFSCNNLFFFQNIFYFKSSIYQSFLYLRKSSFINFFIQNMIDVPICFKKTKSVKLKNFELPVLKFTNLLMRKGQKEKMLNILFSSFFLFFNFLKKNLFFKSILFHNLFEIYSALTNIFLTNRSDNHSLFSVVSASQITYNNFILNNEKISYSSFFIKNFFLQKISNLKPVFGYFIYNVDKNIRKYSRGKSGKYTFIWKYISPYKRLYVSFKWILKDIKFNSSKTVSKRLFETFFLLLFNFENSFSFKSKIYSYNYVFKNFKKTLMLSLRTTTK